MWIDASEEQAGGEAHKAFLPVTTVRLRSAGLATARGPHAGRMESTMRPLLSPGEVRVAR